MKSGLTVDSTGGWFFMSLMDLVKIPGAVGAVDSLSMGIMFAPEFGPLGYGQGMEGGLKDALRVVVDKRDIATRTADRAMNAHAVMELQVPGGLCRVVIVVHHFLRPFAASLAIFVAPYFFRPTAAATAAGLRAPDFLAAASTAANLPPAPSLALGLGFAFLATMLPPTELG